MSETQSKFPTEMVDLPSQGLLYPEGHPLSSGKIELKYMTAREEDILTSANLIEKGVVIDQLLKSLIVTKVDYGDIFIGDKNAIMLAARIFGYGKTYNNEVTCPNCSTKEDIPFDLTQLKYKEIDPKNYNRKNIFEFTLPNSERKIEFKLLNHKDEEMIQKELDGISKAMKGLSRDITTRLRYQIISVDGEKDPKVVNNFILNEFFAMDSRAFRDHYNSLTPDVDFNVGFICNNCGHVEEEMALPISVNFFWPSR